nr:MAG TPA: hypothetical protein [Caudoviricetes sp.]
MRLLRRKPQLNEAARLKINYKPCLNGGAFLLE